MLPINSIKTLEKKVVDALKVGQEVAENYQNEVAGIEAEGKSKVWEEANIETIKTLAGNKLSEIAAEATKNLDILTRQESLWRDTGLLLRNMPITSPNENGEPENKHLEEVTRLRILQESAFMSPAELKASCDDALSDGNLARASLYQRINNSRAGNDAKIDLSHIPIPGQRETLQSIANARAAQSLLIIHFREVTTGKNDSVGKLSAAHLMKA